MPYSIRNLAFAVLTIFGFSAVAAEQCQMLDQMPDGEPQVQCDSHPCPPWYPASSLRYRAGGTTVLLLTVNATGSADSASVATSSNSAELDQAAILAAKRFAFPLYRPDKSLRAQCYRVLFPLDFDPEMRPNNSFKPNPLRGSA
jgi:TonB family protein